RLLRSIRQLDDVIARREGVQRQLYYLPPRSVRIVSNRGRQRERKRLAVAIEHAHSGQRAVDRGNLDLDLFAAAKAQIGGRYLLLRGGRTGAGGDRTGGRRRLGDVNGHDIVRRGHHGRADRSHVDGVVARRERLGGGEGHLVRPCSRRNRD